MGSKFVWQKSVVSKVPRTICGNASKVSRLFSPIGPRVLRVRRVRASARSPLVFGQSRQRFDECPTCPSELAMTKMSVSSLSSALRWVEFRVDTCLCFVVLPSQSKFYHSYWPFVNYEYLLIVSGRVGGPKRPSPFSWWLPRLRPTSSFRQKTPSGKVEWLRPQSKCFVWDLPVLLDENYLKVCRLPMHEWLLPSLLLTWMYLVSKVSHFKFERTSYWRRYIEDVSNFIRWIDRILLSLPQYILKSY